MTFAALLLTHMVWMSPLNIITMLGAFVLFSLLLLARRGLGGLDMLALDAVMSAGQVRPRPDAIARLDMARFVLALPLLIGGATGTLALMLVGPMMAQAALAGGAASPTLGVLMGLGLITTGVVAILQGRRVLGVFGAQGWTAAWAQGALACSVWAAGLALGPVAIGLALLESSPRQTMLPAGLLRA